MLIVEDEPDIRSILENIFKMDGYEVTTAGSAEAGLKFVQELDPAVIILDIMLPRMDGFEMMRELRQISSAPVLFLSAKKDEISRIVGLKMGAADYVPKPFCPEELRLRVKRILSHTNGPHASPAQPVRIGGVEIDFARHAVRVKGRAVSLTPREMQVLELLVAAEGKVVSRERLSQDIWGSERSSEIDIRMVDQIITRLRGKLRPERDVVVTVPRMGYQAGLSVPAAGRSRRKS